jgi:hypothetical protein
MIKEIRTAWNEFWFQPSGGRRLTHVRIGVMIVIALWFASFFADLGYWFGSEGVFSVGASSRILDFAEASRWQRWSPLWLTDATAAYYATLVAGIVLATVAALGYGGRLVLFTLMGVTIAWVHRIMWLSGPVEPLLIPLILYLAIAPTSKVFGRERTGEASVLNNLVLRMIQVHIWIVLAAGFLSQLANLTWWRGEAIWWLSASGRSQMVTLQLLGDHPLLINFFTHLILSLEAVALLAILQRPFRKLGLFAAWGYCLTICIFWCQPLYAAMLAVALVAFLPEPEEA